MEDFFACCLVCLKGKVEHRKSYEELQSFIVLKWKWESIFIDFVNFYHGG